MENSETFPTGSWSFYTDAPRINPSTITLMFKAISVDVSVYQWVGNDGKSYSPAFNKLSDAVEHLKLHGLRRVE